ncbi:MAG TPA: FtsX-like permease family protein [Planctomycetota bacterium]|nr:FtsX-like permease family protein [Planctomycetota bacterium]
MDRRWIHLALLPLYAGVLVIIGAMLVGFAPVTAALAGAAAAVVLLLPAAVLIAGVKRRSPRLVRLTLLVVIAEIVAAGFAFSPGQSTDFGVTKLDETATRARIEYASKTAFSNVVSDARAIAAIGPRHTGSVGLEEVLTLVRDRLSKAGWTQQAEGDSTNLVSPPGEKTIRVTRYPVLTALDAGSELICDSAGPYDATTAKAFALVPNGVQPSATPKDGLKAPLVYLGTGQPEDFDGKVIKDRIAVFEFASGDAWRIAFERGALAAVFLGSADGSGETLRQADAKFVSLVPLNFPRVYIGPAASESVRSLAKNNAAAELHSRPELRTVQTPVLEALIPGTQSTRELLVMTHADARSVAPALSFGGQESFNVASWLALFEYFAKNPPKVSLRFVLTTGHWQTQAAARAYAYAIREAVGPRIAMALGVDLNPETEALILTDDNIGESTYPAQYWWLKKLLFTVDRREPAWIDQIEALSDRKPVDRGDAPSKYLFHAGRASVPGSQWSLWLAPVDQWPPLNFAPTFPAANQAIAQLNTISVAFQTASAYRHRHFTCVDTIEQWLPRAENLKPQLELTFSLLGALADLDPARLPAYEAQPFRGYGGYNNVDVQVLRWNPGILWYDKTPPEGGRTFVMLVPADGRFLRGRSYAYWPRPLAPSRYSHRQLQCMQTIYLGEAGAKNARARFTSVQCGWGSIVYDALALTFDSVGRLTHAFDQGMHGDAEFKFLDRPLSSPNMLFQVPTFECGSIVMPSMIDHDRSDVGRHAENEYVQQWGVGNDQDDGFTPFVPVRAVNEVATHTSADAYAWLQVRDLAMVFLKPGQRCEILAGQIKQRQILFNDDPLLRAELEAQAKREGVSLGDIVARIDREASAIGESKKPEGAKPAQAIVRKDPEFVGYRVKPGEERRIESPTILSHAQLANITRRRLQQYAELNVKSPTAEMYQKRSDTSEKQAETLRSAGKFAAASAAASIAWSEQSHAYTQTFRLLLDVVTTTIFYFLLLLPFGFLVERLLFPQLSLPKTCLVVACVFFAFSMLLYVFHPGFHLASNIFVTVVCFVIVILTLPALFIIVVRGVGLLMEPGARFKKRHSADAERWGVLLAALSLAVNNMRRRKLRTGLTLATITMLVTSLVLLTSTTADTYYDHEKQLSPSVPYRGVQVTNTHDHTHGMSVQATEMMRATYSDRAEVVFRRYFSPGYESSIHCYAIPKNPDAPTTGKRFTVRGAIALQPKENSISRIDQAVTHGRFFRDGDVRACLLEEDLARRMGLSVGDCVRFAGVELELVGTLRGTDVDARIVDLSSRPITPLAFYRPSLTVETPDHLMCSESIYVPDALLHTDAPVVFPIFSVVIVPKPPKDAEIAARDADLAKWLATAKSQTLGSIEQRVVDASSGTLSSAEAARLVSIGEDAAARRALAAFSVERLTIKSIAQEVASQYANVDVYMTQPAIPWEAGSADRVELISAFARVSLKSSSFLILPFLVSFMMLLAIMIGNVYERRTEIQVFSSVGLAPRHVAGMFLAEALVYAGIASVLGYFIGIILLDVFRQAGWLPEDFHPNYFGKVVIWSAVLATSSSLLSVLYPMHIASRMVNPSLERIWRIPTEPANNRWTIPLPFVASGRNDVLGILQFAREFLSHYRGERTGAFTIEADPEFERSGEVAALNATVWLAPFERDLVQQIRIVPRRDEGKNRFHFDLEATRVSGPEYLWKKSNHAFVDALRKQMLIWHSLGDDVLKEYISAGQHACGEAAISPEVKA